MEVFFALYPYSLRKIKGIFVLGKPEVSVVAFASHDFDVYHLGDALTKKGWHLNTLQFPSRFVFTVSFSHSVFRTVPNSIIINCTWQWRRLLQATCSQGLLPLRREREDLETRLVFNTLYSQMFYQIYTDLINRILKIMKWKLCICPWLICCISIFCSIHICVTALNTQPGVADQFIKDVRECTAALLKDPAAKSSGMVRYSVSTNKWNKTNLTCGW